MRRVWFAIPALCTFLALTSSAVAVSAAGYARLSTDVAPVFQRVHLRCDSDSSRYTGWITVDLDVRKPTSTVTLHAEGQDLERLTLTQGGKAIAVKRRAGEEGMLFLAAARPLATGKARLEREERFWDRITSFYGRVLTGGKREGQVYWPTVLTHTTPDMKVCREEVFGPVTTVERYQTFEEAVAKVNDSPYGLQAGVFTRDVERAMLAHREIRVGGIILNDVSAFRADQMPYGGSKESGYGREGLRWAMEEMTEPRIMVVSHVPL